jgi:hypothetical protein
MENSLVVSLSMHFSFPPASSTTFTTDLLCSLMSTLHPIPEAPFGSYGSPTSMSTIYHLRLEDDNDIHDELVAHICHYNGFSFNPAFFDPDKKTGSLVDHSLMKSTDLTTYTGHEFENRNSLSWTWVEVTLGDEICQVEIKTYGYKFMTELCDGESPPILHDPVMHPGVSYLPDHPTSRRNYNDVPYGDVDMLTI